MLKRPGLIRLTRPGATDRSRRRVRRRLSAALLLLTALAAAGGLAAVLTPSQQVAVADESSSALLQSWLGGARGGIQLTVYSLILMAVILWRPTGLMGVATEAYQRYIRRHPARA